LKKNKINRYLKNIGKILISVILLYFVFQKIPFREVTKLWSNINFIYLLIASLLFLASQIISTKRLELFFKANNFHLSFYSNLKLYFIGMFYNFFIPGGIGGDAFKVYLLNKNFGWSAKKITSSLFNDRLSGLLAICVLILAIFFQFSESQILPHHICVLSGRIFFTYFLTKKIFSSLYQFFLKLFPTHFSPNFTSHQFYIFIKKFRCHQQFHHLRCSIFGKFHAQFNFFCRNWSERNALSTSV
jgi:uncharacterized protein (TIRG00374 family)